MKKLFKIFMLKFTNKKNLIFIALAYLIRIMRVLLLISIWRMILVGESNSSLDAILQYTFMSEVFAQFLNIRTPFVNELCFGSVTTRFLRPMSIFMQLGIESVCDGAVDFMYFSIPLILLSPLFKISLIPSRPDDAILFVISLIMAVLVGLIIDFLFASITISFSRAMEIANNFRYVIVMILSGFFIPLHLFPWGIGGIIELLPFASMASAPLQIYVGIGDPLYLISLQMFWGVTLIPITHLIWNRNREKVVLFGG